jgi:hypothetical protein
MKKKAQSEMVGFALIIIVVSVILLIFLSISFKKPNDDLIESFEVEAFIQSTLSYTTDCAVNYVPNYYNIQRLISACNNNLPCIDGKNSCEVLNSSLSGIIENGWKVGTNWPTKGYLLNITVEGEELIGFEKGNITNVNRGTLQVLDGGIDIIFMVYN